MKIAIIGSQCTGKTTLLNKIKETKILSDKFVYLNKVVRSLVKEQNIKINADGAHQKNVRIFNNMVTDRSCIDALAYTLYNKNLFTPQQLEVFEDLFFNTFALYDKIFYLPIEIELKSDGFRSLDPIFRKEIDKLFLYILEKYQIKFVTLRGSIEERLLTFKQNIT